MSSIAQGIGSIIEGKTAADQGAFAKDVAIRNQQALERQAEAEKEASKIEESRIARRSRLVQARLATGAAKSGVGLSGATLDALADAATQFSIDRNLTLRRGLIKSRELRQRGKIIAAQGRFAKSVGKARKRASYIKAGGHFASAGFSAFGGGKTNQTGSFDFSSFGGGERIGQSFLDR